MSCTSCYNGCVETVSDQCVRYTGPTIPALNITTGDTLLHVEEMITTHLVPLLTGTGDVITIAPGDKCALINSFLTGITSPNSTQLFTALIKSVCSLQTQVTAVAADIATLNADYNIGCLTGVTASSDTHAILQAVITRLCSVVADLAALALDVDTNYVKLADLDALIAAYIAGQSGNVTQNYLKMVPYTVVEYYGPLTNFDGTGAGIGSLGWDKIYLCNGSNGTPDKRGRVGVGAILNVPGGPLAAAVDPVYAGNPNYDIEDVAGANTITLNVNQLPSHTHTATASATSSVSDPGHSHYSGYTPKGWSSSGTIGITNELPKNVQTTVSTTGITVATTVNVSNSNTGSNQGHPNIQPVIAAYYIMYIP
jgi:microcystin-dependent protein